ncbi:MAG: LysM peptidoglycan-binding domain-containing protein, partial [Myxococcales bacterium]|nr:LysM peptidoglycan-binding domain-containing protein [Myxococcales bacterium]
MCYGSAVRWWLTLCLALVCAFATPNFAEAKTRTHTVGKGQTLGKIAKRYHVSVAAICNANDIKKTDPIKPGQ